MKGECEIHGPVELVQVPGTKFDFCCPRCLNAGGTDKARKKMGRFFEDKKIIEKCTPGPWRVRDYLGVHVVGPSGHGAMLAVFDRGIDIGTNSPTGWEGKREDAEFMARARNEWPKHIEALERIELVTTDTGTHPESALLQILKILETLR